jgi:hypothetical protein
MQSGVYSSSRAATSINVELLLRINALGHKFWFSLALIFSLGLEVRIALRSRSLLASGGLLDR